MIGSRLSTIARQMEVPAFLGIWIKLRPLGVGCEKLMANQHSGTDFICVQFLAAGLNDIDGNPLIRPSSSHNELHVKSESAMAFRLKWPPNEMPQYSKRKNLIHLGPPSPIQVCDDEAQVSCHAKEVSESPLPTPGIM